MCSGSINDADIRILYVADRFNGSSIRKTEEGDIRFVNFLFDFCRVFSQLRSNRNQFDIVASFETFQNTKAGGSLTTVNKYFCLGKSSFLKYLCFVQNIVRARI